LPSGESIHHNIIPKHSYLQKETHAKSRQYIYEILAVLREGGREGGREGRKEGQN
jgi:hypothetical protein